MSNVDRITGLAIDDILKWVKEDANTASQVVNKLASLDWQQIINNKREQKIQSKIAIMESFIEWVERGGGFCDFCDDSEYEDGYHHGRKYEKVYSWPYSIYPYYGEGMQGKHLCQKCFCKAEKDAEVPYNKRMRFCSECSRLTPAKGLFDIKHRFYCLLCIEAATKRQFSICVSCHKETINIINGYCYDCHSVPLNLRGQVLAHLDRAKKAGTPATLTIKQWEATVTYFNNKCAYCCSRPFQALEHYLPISLGGGTTVDNCIPACQSCNSRKHDMHPDRLKYIFPSHVLDTITRYFQEDKSTPYKVTGRELVIRGK